MPLNRDQVHRIALLARLQLSEQEEVAFTEQLDHILGHFEKLQQLDTTGIEPTAHVGGIEAPFREDVVRNAPAVELLLSNAPERDGAFFKVPKIIE